MPSSKEWQALHYFAKLIPKVCHNINRVTFIFGGPVIYPVNDITPTLITPDVISTLRQVYIIPFLKLIVKLNGIFKLLI